MHYFSTMENRRYFLHLRYKGTNFFGWQIQPNQPSVQEEIEKALSRLHADRPVKITGCGRTDTGVHATHYYAHFDSDLKISPEDLKYKLNLMLPADIGIMDVIPVSVEAHARFDATARTYHYFIHREKDPFIEDVSWLFKQELDMESMAKACLMLMDHKDFECFSKVNTDVSNFECDIKHAIWIRSDKGLIFSITANRFLRNMVRAIVGTLLDVGLNKMTPEEFARVLKSKNRSEAGQSVPAKGLFLAGVEYPFISGNSVWTDVKFPKSTTGTAFDL